MHSTRIVFRAPIWCALVLMLIAADKATKAPPIKGPPLVTVVKTDGTSVRGSIDTADPDQIVLKPTPKPGQKGDPEPLTISWSEIKSVSNGLTSAKLLPKWKLDHKDQLCETCHGDRVVVCSTCEGTLHDPESGKDCPTCKGELLMPCKNPKCKNGIIPCPNPDCLKLSDGNWTSGHGHDHIKLFPGGGWVSDGHLGQVWKIDPKTHQLAGGEICPLCGGKTEIPDPACHGTGQIPCPTCLARKDAPPCPVHCDKGLVKCQVCDGTGLKKS